MTLLQILSSLNQKATVSDFVVDDADADADVLVLVQCFDREARGDQDKRLWDLQAVVGAQECCHLNQT